MQKEKLIEIICPEPTNSCLVNNDTPLESLNLNWKEKDLPERLRTKHVHRLHPYLGKYIPQLVEIFLRKYFTTGQTILDPFCGSGTTLVQANELGINSIGYDISIFNVLLSKAKTDRYDITKLEKEILDILDKTKQITNKNSEQLKLWDTINSFSTESNFDISFLCKWFDPNALKELLAYKYLLNTIDYLYKDPLNIILSRSARSARLVTHYDLDFPKQPQIEPYWCHKHKRTCKPTQEAYKFLCRYSFDVLKRIKEFSLLRTDAFVKVCNVDSRIAVSPKINGIITSPPYVGLIDYHEQHNYAYQLLGLKNNSHNEIGPAINGTGTRAREKYQKDIVEVFKNVTKNMSTNGIIIVIAGDKFNLYENIATNVGFEVEAIINRQVERRTGRRSTKFYESVYIWRKP